MNNICITGISGYLGSRLSQELLKDKRTKSIVGIDIREPTDMPDRLVFYDMDIRDESLGTVFQNHSIETVLHLAFAVKPIHNKKLMQDIDYRGTEHVLSAARKAGVKHIVIISSTLAYGAYKDNPALLLEESPLRGNKRFPYGYNKALVDKMIQNFSEKHKDVYITILRPCTVFGPTVDNYVSRMLFKPITPSILGYNASVQFMHEDDFVDACLLAIEKKVVGVFNLAGNGTLTTREIAAITGAKLIPFPAFIIYPLLDILWKIHFPGIEVNSGYLDYVRYSFIASNEKAKRELGFYPRYSSEETIKITAAEKNKH